MSAPVAGIPELAGSTPSPVGGFDPDELLARLYAQRPDLQALVAAMKQAPRVAPADPRRDAERLERLKKAYSDLYERARELAQALGACVRCWGEDPDCERCGGTGVPGSRTPDPGAFQQYVAPAMAAMRAARSAGAAASRYTGGGNGAAARDFTVPHQTSQGVA
jgi:hypothetical protein